MRSAHPDLTNWCSFNIGVAAVVQGSAMTANGDVLQVLGEAGVAFDDGPLPWEYAVWT